MTALTWDSDPVSDGLERVVLFLPSSPEGVPWNGLTEVTPNESGNSTTLYFDGVPFAVSNGKDSYSANLGALTYPEEFEVCEAPPHVTFGLSYRETGTESDVIHLIWNATAEPSVKSWRSNSAEIDLSTFSWDISTVPDEVEGLAPVSHLAINVFTAPPDAVSFVEDAVYGTEASASYLPSPQEVLDRFHEHALVKVTDLGDGTFEVEGPEDLVRQIDDTTWDIESGGITYINEHEFEITTW